MQHPNDRLLRELLDEGCSHVRASRVADYGVGPDNFTVVAYDSRAFEFLTERLFPASAASGFVVYLCVGTVPEWALEHSGPSHLERLHTAEEGLIGQYDGDHKHWSIWDPVTRRGLFWVESLDLLPEWHRAAPFRSILQWALTDTPYTLAHAGGVGGTLLVGKGGSGKSTTVFACARAGMPTCGDDLVVVGNGNAYPLYDAAKLRFGSLEVADGVDFGDKRLYRLSDLGTVAAMPIHSIAVPMVGSESTSTLSPCRASEALRALAPSTVFLLRGRERACVEKLAALVRSVPTYRLHLGADHGVSVLKELACRYP